MGKKILKIYKYSVKTVPLPERKLAKFTSVHCSLLKSESAWEKPLGSITKFIKKYLVRKFGVYAVACSDLKGN